MTAKANIAPNYVQPLSDVIKDDWCHVTFFRKKRNSTQWQRILECPPKISVSDSLKIELLFLESPLSITHIRNVYTKLFLSSSAIKDNESAKYMKSVETGINQEFYREPLIVVLRNPFGTIITGYTLREFKINARYNFELKDFTHNQEGTYYLEIRWKNHPLLIKKIIVEAPKPLKSFRLELEYGLNIFNPNTEAFHNIIVDIAIPPQIPSYQHVKSIKWFNSKTNGHIDYKTVKKEHLTFDEYGNTYLRIKIKEIAPYSGVQIGYKATATTSAEVYDFSELIPVPPSLFEESTPPQVLREYQQWLQHEPGIEIDDPEVRLQLKEIFDRSYSYKDWWTFLFESIQFIWSKLDYQIQEEEKGAKFALKTGQGDCTEFASTFVALCRIRGIPARLRAGLMLSSQKSWNRHTWAEVYHAGLNKWFQVDPTLRTIGHEPNKVILLTNTNWIQKDGEREIQIRFSSPKEAEKYRRSREFHISYNFIGKIN